MSTRRVRSPEPFTVEHYRAWTAGLILDSGEPWELEDFQAQFVRDLFRGYVENWLVIPEGNAKTTLVSGVALYVARFKPRASVVIAASAKDQAFWLYDSAAGFVSRSGLGPKAKRTAHHARPDEPEAFWCYEGLREIRVGDSRIKVFAADDRTGDGAIFDLAILEELHRHRDLRLYRTWRGKAQKRKGQLIAISTAGEPEGEFEIVREKMKAAADKITVKGAFTRAVSDTTVIQEYALPEGKDPTNMRHVLMANPLKAITRETLQENYDSPSMTPEHWDRFKCGRPAHLDSQAPITPEDWDALKVDIGQVRDGETVWAAVRYLQTGVGIGIAALRGEGIAVRIETPTYDFPGMIERLRQITQRYNVRAIYVDRNQFGGESLADAVFAGLGVEHDPQSPVRLMEATSTFLRLISSRTLHHDGDETLRKQVLMARVKETTSGAYFAPSETAALTAAIVAIHEAIKHASDKPPRIHAYRGA